MADPNDPRPAAPAPSAAAPPPPRPRWRRHAAAAGAGAVWVSGLAVVVVALGVLGVVWFSRRPEGGRLSLQLANRALARVSNLRLSAERSLLLEHGARLIRPVVSVIDSTGQAHPLLVAEDVVVHTSWWSLLRGTPESFAIELKRPDITFERRADGHLWLPAFHSSGRPPSSTARGDYRIHLAGGSVRVRNAEGRFDTLAAGIELTARARQRAPHWDIVLDQGTGELPAADLRLVRAEGEAAFENGRLEVPQVRLRTNAGWVEAHALGTVLPRIDLSGALEVGEWNWRRIAQWLDAPALDVSGGFAGGMAFAASGDTVRFTDGDFDVLWRDEPAHITAGGRWGDGLLTLDPATVEWRRTSLAGTFRWDSRPRGGWSIDGRLAGLDLAELPRLWPMAPLDPSSIDASVRLGGDANGLVGTVARGSGRWRDITFSALEGMWRLAGDVQSIDARAAPLGGALTVRGTIGPHAIDLATTANGIAAGALPSAWWSGLGLAHAPAGRIEALDARISGPASAPSVVGTARVREAAYDAFAVDAATLVFDGRAGAGAGGIVRAQATDGNLGPARADSATADLTFAGDRVTVTSFRAVRGDSILVFRGEATRAGRAWRLQLEDLSWNVGTSLALTGDGPLVARLEPGGAIVIERMHVISNAGSFAAHGTWGGRGAATDLAVDLEKLDLEAILGALVEGAPGRGVVTGHAQVSGPADALVYNVDLEGNDLRWRGFEPRSVVARGRFAGDVWQAERLEIDTGRGRLRFDGTVEWDRPPDLGGGSAAWNDALTRSPRWHGKLVADSLAVDLIATWLPQVGGWRGVLDATFALDGRPAAPLLGVTGTLHRPGWGQATLEDFAIDLDYRDELVRVRKFAVAGPESIGPAISGELPLRLGWGVAEGDRLPDRPMHLVGHARGLDLGLVPLVLPQIAAAGGRFDFDAQVTGTPKRPDVSGAITLRDGIVRPAGREEVLTAVNGRIALQGDSLAIENLSAQQGKRGRYTVRPGGHGSIRNLRIQTYALDVDVRAGTAFSSGEYVLVMDGEFAVTNGLDLGGPMPLPHIEGTARVQEGLFLYNFADPSRAEATQGPLTAPPWTYRIAVEARNNVWYRPSDANIEGKLNDFEVIQEPNRFLLLGGVEALRGRYFFLENGFDLVTGTLAFDTAKPLDPVINATLTTEKVRAAREANTPVRETITLTVSGRAMSPLVTLSSSSGRSQAEIVSLLTVGQIKGGGRALVATGSQFLARQLINQVPEIGNLLGNVEVGERVSEGDLGSKTASQSFTTVGVTRYFTRDLLVRYSQVVGDVSQTAAVDYQDLTAEYRLNRLLFLSGQVTRRRGTLVITPQDQTIYNLDVRARHEY